MKFTLKQVLQIRPSLERFLRAGKLPAKIGFKIKPWSKAVRGILRGYDETVEQRIKELGVETPTGAFKIPEEEPETQKKFFKEIEALQEAEVEFPDEKISMKEIESVEGLVAEDFAALDFLIKE